MVNEAILSSLRNALDRGEDVDTAIRSMISAGYDRFEVNEAAKVIIKEIAELQIPEGQRPPAQSQISIQSLVKSQKSLQTPKPKNKKLLLIVIIVFLLAIAGALLYFLIKKYL